MSAKHIPDRATCTILLRNIYKGVLSLIRNGPKETLRKAAGYRTGNVSFGKVKNRMIFSEAELIAQKKDGFSQNISFSLILPVEDSPEETLRDTIRSVLGQTYSRYTLCLVQTGTGECAAARRLCEQYGLRYILPQTPGFSKAVNMAARLLNGDYISLLFPGDRLHPSVLHQMMKAICEGNADFLYTDEGIFSGEGKEGCQPLFKPDYSPETLLSTDCIGRFTAVYRAVFEKVGGLRDGYEPCAEYDYLLRAADEANCVAHIPMLLYYRREAVSKTEAGADAQAKAARDFLLGKGILCKVESDAESGIRRLRYELSGRPRISVLIPNCEHLEVLKRCIDSILSKTTYENYEIIIVENNSKSREIFEYYALLEREHQNIRVVSWKGDFNYSAINNYGVGYCGGELLLLLNNDTEVISPEWMEEMLMFAQQESIGAVGAKLYYPNGRIQHAGVVLVSGGVATHYYHQAEGDSKGYMNRLRLAQNQSCVTAACMMLRRKVWDEIGGLDESLKVAFNDVDFCLKIREKGYRIVWTPFSELYHHESLSRGIDGSSEKARRYNSEIETIRTRWAKVLEEGDPYFNPNFIDGSRYFSFKMKSSPYPARYTRKQKNI